MSFTSLSFALTRSRRDLPQDQELAAPRFAADEGETEKVEGLRFAEPASRSVRRRMAAELDDPGLVRVERKRKRLEPRPHRLEETPRVGLELEAEDMIVGVTHDDHVSFGFAPPPLRGPEIDDVVEVDVGEQRRDHRPLSRPLFADRHDPVLKDARLEPLLDQAEDADVGPRIKSHRR